MWLELSVGPYEEKIICKTLHKEVMHCHAAIKIHALGSLFSIRLTISVFVPPRKLITCDRLIADAIFTMQSRSLLLKLELLPFILVPCEVASNWKGAFILVLKKYKQWKFISARRIGWNSTKQEREAVWSVMHKSSWIHFFLGFCLPANDSWNWFFWVLFTFK